MFYVAKGRASPYAHIEIVVNLIVVNFFSFLVIAPSPSGQFGRKQVETIPMSLPDLLIPTRTRISTRKPQFLDPKIFQKTGKTKIDVFGPESCPRVLRISLQGQFFTRNPNFWVPGRNSGIQTQFFGKNVPQKKSVFLISYFFRKFVSRIGKERFITNQQRFKIVNEAFGAFKETKLGGL